MGVEQWKHVAVLGFWVLGSIFTWSLIVAGLFGFIKAMAKETRR